jgi:6-phosphogluconolactonase
MRVFPGADGVARAAADLFVATAAEAVRTAGSFGVALSGGTTPAAFFGELRAPERAGEVDWKAVHLFWGDERCVPPDHPDSNFGMAHREFLAYLPPPLPVLHRIRGEDDPVVSAGAYEAELRGFSAGRPAGRQGLDLVFLGLGADGHTASLFPGTGALEETERWVRENTSPGPGTWRVTLTLPAIHASRLVVFLVTGREKAGILARVLAQPGDVVDPFPARRVNADPHRVLWLVDEAAATGLGR